MFKKNVKHLLSKGAAAVLSAALVATSFSGIGFQPASAAEGDVTTDLASFDDVSADKIAEVMSPGWNLGNQMESAKTSRVDGKWVNKPDETAYGNPVITSDIFHAVKEAGFRSVRIPVSYFDHIGDEASGYHIDDAWMNRIKEVVDMALAEGLYVAINMHGDGYNSIQNGWLLCNASEDKQPGIKAKYGAVWKQIATVFQSYDEHLIFESMNEEFDGTTYNGSDIKKEYYDNINAYNQIFVDSVREAGGNNPSRWLVVCGWNTDIEFTCGDYGFQMPTDTKKAESAEGSRLMLSVHEYAPWGFCGGEDGETTQWGSFTTNGAKTAATNEAGLAAAFDKLQETFTSKGIPVFIGEYGAIDKTAYDEDSNIYRAYYAQKVCENSKRIGAVPMYWDNGFNGKFGFGIFDRTKAGAVTQQGIIDAITKVYETPEADSSATTIKLDKEKETVQLGKTCQLTATLDPADPEKTVTWTSSNETVAVVNANGLVKATGTGTATIVASLANGNSASCTIEVPEAGLECRFYASNTASWSVSYSDPVYIQSGVAQSYTAKMTMSKESMSNIGALYLKDAKVEGGTATMTGEDFYCHVTVKSFKVNGVEIPLIRNEDIDAINDNYVLDMTVLNKWNLDAEMIENMPTSKDDSRSFDGYPGVTLSDSNTIEIEFETLANPNPPAPGGDATPAPGANATPTPGGNVTPAPGTNNTPGTVTAPKKVTLKKVKSTKKKTLLVQWTKINGVTGYKVQIAKDKKFKKGKKTYTVKGAKTTKKTIKKLKSKKKYFARVCAYKKASGKTATGKWSKVKSVKVK